MRIAAGMTLALCAITTSGLDAQDTAAFGRLEPGQTVRVKTVGGSRFTTPLGYDATGAPGSLFVGAATPFEAQRVDSLWVRGNAAVTGMLVGAAVLTPTSFAFWWWVCSIVSEGQGCDAFGTVAGLAVAGGAAGALLGAGIGALVPKWRLRYARDRAATLTPLLTGDGRIGLAVRY